MRIQSILAGALLAGTALTGSAQVTIEVNPHDLGVKVSPTLYGIFFEDINHAADGGLYAELIRNRSFEDSRKEAEAWSTINTGKSSATIKLVKDKLLNKAQGQALQVSFDNATASEQPGIANTGYWGINAVAGRRYKLSFWAKADKGYKGTLTASLQDAQGQVLASAPVAASLNGKWQKLTAELTATGSDPKACFTLTADKAGTITIDVVSLFPPTFKNRENGMRPGLAQMLADMKPQFMRFPGGCFVEGQESPDNAFRWERTIGPIEERPGHKNVNWGYRTTDGIGYHEYLQLAEDLGAKPLYVVNVGLWHGGMTPYNEIEPWIEECMNAIEYANGPVTSKYGALRAKNGHPEPFNLEYLEIGNENNQPDPRQQSDHYYERYIQFYKAIKAKYPNMKCIGNVVAWGDDNPKWNLDYPTELVDEHYYRNPSWFADRFHMYDSYPRTHHEIYVGEYAVTSQFGDIGNLNAALGEAVYMMGMENNSDVVTMASYAPIFVNENNAAWRPDMIRFNSHHAMGTPSYYVQKLFPNNIGTRVVKTSMSCELPKMVFEQPQAPVRVGVATWNTQARFADPQLIVEGQAVSVSDFNQWENHRGQWSVAGSELVQSGQGSPSMSIAPNPINAKKYSFKVRAQKTGGDEGFILVFGYQNPRTNNYFNVGGWGNTQNNIEQGEDGGKIQLIPSGKRGHVENGRWYDLQVDVDGDSITCFINGQKEFGSRLRNSMMEGVYASTTLDEPTNTMIVKVVNTGAASTSGLIRVKEVKIAEASLERMASEKGTDENTLADPNRIMPVKAHVSVEGDDDQAFFDVMPYSINIIRLKLK